MIAAHRVCTTRFWDGQKITQEARDLARRGETPSVFSPILGRAVKMYK